MYRFSYPAEKYNEAALDKNIILTLVKKHEGMVARLWKNKQYYEGHHSIEYRNRKDNAPNNKVVCNHAKDISDIATGYFMGNPITYSNSGKQEIEPLLVAFDDANVDDVDADNAMDMTPPRTRHIRPERASFPTAAFRRRASAHPFRSDRP